MILKKIAEYWLIALLLAVVAFGLGFYFSRFHPVCGNGLKEYGETLETCPWDCGLKVYPFETDAVKCIDESDKIYPTAGKDAGQWFFYGCGKEKIYRVSPNERAEFIIACGDRDGWRDNRQAFSVWEKKNGKWWQMQAIVSQKEWPGKLIIPYAPKSGVIKIKADKFFYLDVYTEKAAGRVYVEAEKEPEPANEEAVDYENKEFNYKVKMLKSMKIENLSRDKTDFFHNVYGRNPLDTQKNVPVVSVRVVKRWGRKFSDCLGEGTPHFSNCSKSNFSWPPANREVSGYTTFQMQVQCNEEEYRGLAVAKGDFVYIIMFLMRSEIYTALPAEIGNRILDSFDFMEGLHETAP